MKGLYETDLESIFVLLHLKDKIECMTVCKTWSSLIKSTCLLETIRISNIKQFKRICKKIQARPSRATQVKRLFFDLGPLKNFDYGLFLDSFTNLEVVVMDNAMATQFPTTIRPSRPSRIKYIYDSGGHALNNFYLSSYKCTRLEELLINEFAFMTPVPKTFINLLLRYMPYLTKIDIRLVTIQLNMLESLHEALPSLQSLHTNTVTLLDGEVREMIQPAKTVTDLAMTMDDSVAISTQVKYLEYARKKYPNLTEFTYLNNNFAGESLRDIDVFYNDGMIPFLQPLLTKLKKHEIVLPKMPGFLKDVLDSIAVKQSPFRLDFNSEITREEMIKCIQSREEGFKYNRTNFNKKSAIKHAKFTQFYNADLLKYVEVLELSSDQPIDLEMLKEFTSLKKLHIYVVVMMNPLQLPILDFNDLLVNLPGTVESLHIDGLPITFKTLPDRKYPHIKQLSFYSDYIDAGIDDMIADYFPRLERLMFDSVRFTQTTFDLSNLDLLYLRVRGPSYLVKNYWVPKKDLHVLISAYATRRKDTRREKRLWSSMEGPGYLKSIQKHIDYSDCSAYPHVTNMPYVKGQMPEPYLTFELGSVNNVVINNSAEQLNFGIPNFYFRAST